jgi:hypothetical protein
MTIEESRIRVVLLRIHSSLSASLSTTKKYKKIIYSPYVTFPTLLIMYMNSAPHYRGAEKPSNTFYIKKYFFLLEKTIAKTAKSSYI